MAKVTKKHRLRSFFIGLIGTVIVILGALVIYNHFQKTSRPQTIKLTAVGDSLTQGVGDPKGKGGYVNLIRKKVNHQKSNVTMTTANFGISGETTNQINHRVVTSKRLKRNLRQADMITVTTGGNDLIQFLKANISLGNNQGLKDHLDSYCVTYQKKSIPIISKYSLLESFRASVRFWYIQFRLCLFPPSLVHWNRDRSQ